MPLRLLFLFQMCILFVPFVCFCTYFSSRINNSILTCFKTRLFVIKTCLPSQATLAILPPPFFFKNKNTININIKRQNLLVKKSLLQCTVSFYCLLLSNPPSPSPSLSSPLSPCKNWLFGGFDKRRSQTPVTSSTAAGAFECCESESDLLHFISSSTHTQRKF